MISLIESAVFTILGGLVAGGVGYLANIISLREQRKQKHLEDHKKNLKALSKALDQLWSEVWPFVYGAEDLKLPKPPFGNEKRVQNIDIKTEPIAMEIPNPSSNDSRVIQVGIDEILYDDIPVHFPELHKLLEKTELDVKENGKEILKLLNSLSANIYEKLVGSEIDFPYWDGNKTVFKKFRDLKNEILETDFAGSVFLMVLGEDEGNWPRKVGRLKNNRVYDELKNLSEAVKIQFGDELDHLRWLHDKIFNLIHETKEEIERNNLATRLNGRCRYL
ncbi:hypothetical protein [Caldiplasma sukawensis]